MHTEYDAFAEPDGRKIHVVSSDLSLREQIHRWMAQADIAVRSFAQMADLLHHYEVTAAGCLVLDVRTLGALGLSCISVLRKQHDYCQPALVITRGDDVYGAVTAMKLGAVDVMHEPLDERHLVGRIREAMTLDEAAQREHRSRINARHAIRSLTGREREVLGHLLQGSANKEIAVHLGMNSKTASTHRTNILQKLGASNIVDLVRLVNSVQQVA